MKKMNSFVCLSKEESDMMINEIFKSLVYLFDHFIESISRSFHMNRATLKIEIPFTDHAHCIGRQGNQIQSIMTSTNTHIHFPDGNRDPNSTKSNQVSITGSIQSIANAHQLVKEILPMSLKFLLPWKQSNNEHPAFDYVRQRYHLQVLSRCSKKTGEIFCIIRGRINQKELPEATEYLIQVFYAFQSSSINVTCQIEVTEQYQIYLQTRQQSKDLSIASIEEYTHTNIQFPTMMMNHHTGRRTSVIITGSPMQVCQARKFFDLCLPIILTFEIPIEKEPTREEILHMKDQLNIITMIQTRKDRFDKFISLQTQEYNSEELYHAHSIIFDFSSKLSKPSSISISSTDLLPMKFNSSYSKFSPIGYERSSSMKKSTSNY